MLVGLAALLVAGAVGALSLRHGGTHRQAQPATTTFVVDNLPGGGTLIHLRRANGRLGGDTVTPRFFRTRVLRAGQSATVTVVLDPATGAIEVQAPKQ